MIKACNPILKKGARFFYVVYPACFFSFFVSGIYSLNYYLNSQKNRNFAL